MRGLSGKVCDCYGWRWRNWNRSCKRFAEEGATVAVFDIDKDAEPEERLRRLRRSEVKQLHFLAISLVYSACQNAVRSVETTVGPVDVLVNNAGWDVFRAVCRYLSVRLAKDYQH